MKRIRVIGLILLAVSALTGIAASNASAGGPLWRVAKRHCKFEKFSVNFGAYLTELACENKSNEEVLPEGWVVEKTLSPARLLTGEMSDVKVTAVGNFVLKSSAAIIVCTTTLATTLLLGGSPGRSDTHILWHGCIVQDAKGKEFASCKVRSKGEENWGLILVRARDVLVYIGTKAQAEKEEGPLGDLFTPEEGTTFVELEFEGTCPAGVTSPTKVTGSVIGEVTPVNTLSKEGKLIFPEKAITKGFEWEGEGKVKEVKSSLKIFGTLTATQIGEATVELESGEEWGVTTN